MISENSSCYFLNLGYDFFKYLEKQLQIKGQPKFNHRNHIPCSFFQSSLTWCPDILNVVGYIQNKRFPPCTTTASLWYSLRQLDFYSFPCKPEKKSCSFNNHHYHVFFLPKKNCACSCENLIYFFLVIFKIVTVLVGSPSLAKISIGHQDQKN